MEKQLIKEFKEEVKK